MTTQFIAEKAKYPVVLRVRVRELRAHQELGAAMCLHCCSRQRRVVLDMPNGGIRITYQWTVEIEGKERPACVAETMSIADAKTEATALCVAEALPARPPPETTVARSMTSGLLFLTFSTSRDTGHNSTSQGEDAALCAAASSLDSDGGQRSHPRKSNICWIFGLIVAGQRQPPKNLICGKGGPRFARPSLPIKAVLLPWRAERRRAHRDAQ
jgi:hypothetical protein